MSPIYSPLLISTGTLFCPPRKAWNEVRKWVSCGWGVECERVSESLHKWWLHDSAKARGKSNVVNDLLAWLHWAIPGGEEEWMERCRRVGQREWLYAVRALKLCSGRCGVGETQFVVSTPDREAPVIFLSSFIHSFIHLIPLICYTFVQNKSILLKSDVLFLKLLN